MSYTKLSLLSGVIWAAWHSPLLLFADYNAGTNRLYAMGCFTVMIVANSFAFAWLRLRLGSLWTAAVLHASHNLFIQTVDNMMRNTGKTLWYTTEFGAALAAVNVAFAVYFWTRRGEVEKQDSEPKFAAGIESKREKRRVEISNRQSGVRYPLKSGSVGNLPLHGAGLPRLVGTTRVSDAPARNTSGGRGDGGLSPVCRVTICD
jgi:hypothetical protein